MVIGWQNSAALEEGPGNDWRNSRPPRTKLREYYELGLRVVNLSYSLSNQFGGGMLDPKAPLTTQGKYLVGKMQDITAIDRFSIRIGAIGRSHRRPRRDQFLPRHDAGRANSSSLVELRNSVQASLDYSSRSGI